MIREILQDSQPIVYKTLQNSLVSKKLAHAFLFNGPKGTPKKETAFLLAQSLACENTVDGFACEECSTCKRIKENLYADVIYIDGEEASIKKGTILELQEQFSKTALERSGKKIYIIDHVENATAEALNSLLKFLEEPSGVDTTAILITDNIDRILPTIVSRCQIIPFKPLKLDKYYELALADGLDVLNAYVLSHIVKGIDMIKELAETDEYQTALAMAQRYIETFDNKYALFLVDVQTDYLKPKKYREDIDDGDVVKDKNRNRNVFRYFVDICSMFFKDVASGNTCDDEWYQRQINRVVGKHYNVERIMLILLESKDKCNRTNNLQLLVDQMIYQISKEVS